MSTLTMPPPVAKTPQPIRVPYRITVEQYQQIVHAGILGKYDRCELIEGLLVEKPVRIPPHDNTLLKTDRRLTRGVPDGWLVRKQSALILDDSVPEPDVALVRGDDDMYARRHPRSSDVGMLTEISDSTLKLDREMRRVYARNRIPVYWIVNLVDNIIEVYTQPSGPTESPDYASRQDFARGDMIPVVLDGVNVASLPVADLLPS